MPKMYGSRQPQAQQLVMAQQRVQRDTEQRGDRRDQTGHRKLPTGREAPAVRTVLHQERDRTAELAADGKSL